MIEAVGKSFGNIDSDQTKLKFLKTGKRRNLKACLILTAKGAGIKIEKLADLPCNVDFWKGRVPQMESRQPKTLADAAAWNSVETQERNFGFRKINL